MNGNSSAGASLIGTWAYCQAGDLGYGYPTKSAVVTLIFKDATPMIAENVSYYIDAACKDKVTQAAIDAEFTRIQKEVGGSSQANLPGYRETLDMIVKGVNFSLSYVSDGP